MSYKYHYKSRKTTTIGLLKPVQWPWLINIAVNEQNLFGIETRFILLYQILTYFVVLCLMRILKWQLGPAGLKLFSHSIPTRICKFLWIALDLNILWKLFSFVNDFLSKYGEGRFLWKQSNAFSSKDSCKILSRFFQTHVYACPMSSPTIFWFRKKNNL